MRRKRRRRSATRKDISRIEAGIGERWTDERRIMGTAVAIKLFGLRDDVSEG